MMKSGDYDDKVIIRRVEMGVGSEVTGFDGKSIGADELARGYQVFVTPTVVVVGPDGRQLADKLVGYGSRDFYGSYLDSAIDTSLEQMRSMDVAANP
jgi:thioredoxin-related protein